MFSVVTLCWTLHPFYTLIYKRAKPQKKVEALRMKPKLTVSMEVYVRENTRTG